MYLLDFILKLGKESDNNSSWIFASLLKMKFSVYKAFGWSDNKVYQIYLSKLWKVQQTRKCWMETKCGFLDTDLWYGKLISLTTNELLVTSKVTSDVSGRLVSIIVEFLERFVPLVAIIGLKQVACWTLLIWKWFSVTANQLLFIIQ